MRCRIFIIFIVAVRISKAKFLFDYHFNMEAKYWSKIFHNMMECPQTVFFNEVLIDKAVHTHDFFSALTNQLYSIETKCVNLVTVKTHHVEKIRDWMWFNQSDNCFISNHSIGNRISQTETFFFNKPNTARIVVMTFQSIVSLMENEFIYWNREQFTVLLIVFENYREILENCEQRIVETVMSLSSHILETIWKKYGAHNIFIGFPLLTSSKSRLWFYDPFYNNGKNQESGRIIGINPKTPLTFRRLRDLQQYKLNIGIFEAKLTPKKVSNHTDINDFSGVDGYLLQTIAKYLNFTVQITPPSGGVKYGYLKNDKAFGTLADVIYRRIHASFNSQYIKNYNIGFASQNSTNVTFTVPIGWDHVCIIVPSPEEVPRWLRAFFHMQYDVWCLLFTVIFVSTIVWYTLRNHHPIASRIYSKCDKNHLAVFLDTLMLIVGAPVRLRNIFAERILTASLALVGLIIIGAFTGTWHYNFSKNIYYRSIDTLEELDASSLPICTASPDLFDIFGPRNPLDFSTIFARLANRIKYIGTGQTFKRVALDRDCAGIYQKAVFSIKKYDFLDFRGASLVHQVSECPQSYYLAYLLPADSIILDSFNSIATALSETGITLLWNKNTYESIMKERKLACLRGGKVSKEPSSFSVHDMKASFLILAIGIIISLIIFIFELIHASFL